LDKIRIFFDTTNYENVVEDARLDTQCGEGFVGKEGKPSGQSKDKRCKEEAGAKGGEVFRKPMKEEAKTLPGSGAWSSSL
jgi:hypothetical protein